MAKSLLFLIIKVLHLGRLQICYQCLRLVIFSSTDFDFALQNNYHGKKRARQTLLLGFHSLSHNGRIDGCQLD